jgi:hypothetical protein
MGNRAAGQWCCARGGPLALFAKAGIEAKMLQTFRQMDCEWGVSWSTSQIMRNLLKRASYLFWQYPRLWLPVLAAEVLKYWIFVVDRAGERAVRLALTPHSVLGGQLEPPRGFAQLKIAVATGAIFWPALFIGVVLYMAALGIVAHSLWHMDANHGSVLRLQWIKPAKLFRYSAAMIGRCLLAAVVWLLMLALLMVVFHLHRNSFSQAGLYGAGGGLAVCCALFAYSPIRAFLLSNLMRPSATVPPIRYGPRIAATVVIVAFIFLDYILGYFCNHVINPIQSAHHLFGSYIHHAMYMLTSLITAIPFIFGMIVFILIVQQEAQEPRDIPQGDESPVDGLAGSL